MNYYNEFDKGAAAWLRELVAMELIPAGDVDERSILDVKSNELKGYTQCHFFAGIAGWSLALQRAGWDSARPVWTGSCPCQAFSVAGAGKGTGDHRDLWPVFASLIRECRPGVVLGEQVEAAIGYGWLDRLRADMEAEDYAVGCAVLGAHSAGAPHRRQRLYWVAESQNSDGRGELATGSEECRRSGLAGNGGMGNSGVNGIGGGSFGGLGADRQQAAQPENGAGVADEPCDGCEDAGPMADTAGRLRGVDADGERQSGKGRHNDGMRGTSNFWSNAVAIPCRDGKARLTEPGVAPLVASLPRGMVYGRSEGLPQLYATYAQATAEGRVMRLKGYGNAVCVETAAQFIAAMLESERAK